MATVTKHRTVMDFEPNILLGYESDRVLFWRFDDEPPNHVGELYEISLEDWVEMGSPDKITVTIEPGDLLSV